MKIEEKLSFLNSYYHKTIGVGHTHTVLKGAEDSKCILLTHTSRYGDSLKKELKPTSHVVSLSSDFRTSLMGCRLPIVFDNGALSYLFAESSERIAELKDDISFLRKALVEARKEDK